MPSPAKFLWLPGGFAAAPLPETPQVGSGAAIIIPLLVFSLLSMVGVAWFACCACLGRSSLPLPPPNKGLNKKALMLLPKLSFDGAVAAGGRMSECPICLSEFQEGEEIRLLPQCGHGFHVVCVHTWLMSHSSCPSCRRVLVVLPPPSLCRQTGGSADVALDLEGRANGLLA